MAGLDIVKTIHPDGSSEVKIENVHVDLMYNYFDDVYFNQFDVVPFAEMMDDSYVTDHEQVYQEYKGIITEMDDSITVGGFE